MDQYYSGGLQPSHNISWHLNKMIINIDQAVTVKNDRLIRDSKHFGKSIGQQGLVFYYRTAP